jgi:hypothetical protein
MSNEKSGRVISAANAAHLKSALDSMKAAQASFAAMKHHHAAASAHIAASAAHIDLIGSDAEGATPLTDNELSFDVERIKRSLRLAELSFGDGDVKH